MLNASFSVPPEALALEETVQAAPGIELEAERVAAHSSEWVMPCLWVSATAVDDLADVLRSDPSIDALVERKRFDEETFVQVEWSDDVERRINDYVDKEGSILEARLADGEWTVDVRFASREQFDTFREALAEQGHSFTLRGLDEPETPHQTFQRVTPTQRDALVMAAKRGYFEVPRGTDLETLADELGTSHQALSELLRRGVEELVFSTLTADEGPDRGRDT